ncbi:unnamed protein product [Mytilus edulis]|uniref:REJ domain-containing protein n=1 Tax=Mytilus edulis TaxID=6550 RepID=A0A8S3UPX4_MYTED|nr:unnamed protein product [Mytilus edulis]
MNVRELKTIEPTNEIPTTYLKTGDTATPESQSTDLQVSFHSTSLLQATSTENLQSNTTMIQYNSEEATTKADRNQTKLKTIEPTNEIPTTYLKTGDTATPESQSTDLQVSFHSTSLLQATSTENLQSNTTMIQYNSEEATTKADRNQTSTDFGYNTTFVYMKNDCFEIKTLFSTSYKDENSPLRMLITNDNTITSQGVVALICRNSHRDYNWHLWRKLQNGTYVKDKYLVNPANQPKSAAIIFAKESIPEGNYLLRMSVYLIDYGQFLEDEIYVEFGLPPIITSIQGGSVRYISKDNDVVIDAGSVTYDKVQKYKIVPFNYEWLCRKGLNQSQVDAVLGKFGLPGAPDIITLGTSCNESSWGAKWTIPSENLSIDTWCRKNCLPKLSLNSLLILYADCPECSLSDTIYEWSILVYNHTTEVFDSLNSVPSINQSRLVVTSLTADEIGIRPDAFREMDRIRFHLLIRTPGIYHSEADYIVSVNAPPYGGSCSITPNTGMTVKTRFTIACKNWFDEGDRYIYKKGQMMELNY